MRLDDLERENQIWKESYERVEEQIKQNLKKKYNFHSKTENYEKIDELLGYKEQLATKLEYESQQHSYFESISREQQQEIQNLKLLVEECQVQVRGAQRSNSKINKQEIDYYEQEIASLRSQLKDTQDQLQFNVKEVKNYQQQALAFQHENQFYKQKLTDMDGFGKAYREMENKVI